MLLKKRCPTFRGSFIRGFTVLKTPPTSLFRLLLLLLVTSAVVVAGTDLGPSRDPSHLGSQVVPLGPREWRVADDLCVQIAREDLADDFRCRYLGRCHMGQLLPGIAGCRNKYRTSFKFDLWMCQQLASVTTIVMEHVTHNNIHAYTRS